MSFRLSGLKGNNRTLLTCPNLRKITTSLTTMVKKKKNQSWRKSMKSTWIINTNSWMCRTWKFWTWTLKLTNCTWSNGETFHMLNRHGRPKLWSTMRIRSYSLKTGTKFPIGKPEKESRFTTKSISFSFSSMSNRKIESWRTQTLPKCKRNYICSMVLANNPGSMVERTSQFSRIIVCWNSSSLRVWIGW